MPKEIEDCVVGKIFLFKVALRNEDDFLHLKPYNVKKVITDVALIEKYSVNVVANLEASKTAATYEDMYLNECSTLSQIVDFPDLGSDVDSLKVFYIFEICIVYYCEILILLSYFNIRCLAISFYLLLAVV